MAIDTFGALKTAIADFMNRSDMTTAQAENFVALTESDLRNDVRVRAQRVTTAITATGQSFSHPALMLEADELRIDGYGYELVNQEDYTKHRKAGTSSRVFTSLGSSFQVNVGDGVTNVLTLTYIEALAAFTASTNTNYVLTYAPDVYLYGACAHAAQYYQDAANLERYKALYLGAVKRLNEREQAASWSGSMLQIYPANNE